MKSRYHQQKGNSRKESRLNTNNLLQIKIILILHMRLQEEALEP